MGSGKCRLGRAGTCRSVDLTVWRARYLPGIHAQRFDASAGAYRLEVDGVKVCLRPADSDCEHTVLQSDSPEARAALKHTGSGTRIADRVVLLGQCESARVKVAVVEFKRSTDEAQITRAYTQVDQLRGRIREHLTEQGAVAVDYVGFVVAPKGARPPRRVPTLINFIPFAGPAFSTDIRAAM